MSSSNNIILNSEKQNIPVSKNNIFQNNTLSIIIRCHKEERLPFLDEALFSLAIQYWKDLEILIMLQNGTKKFKFAVEKLYNKQPFSGSCKLQIHNIEIPIGMDGRSTLLNYGIQNATGRYIGFLDDDDVIYQHAYKILIDQILNSDDAIAVGGCQTAKLKKDDNTWYIETKETPFAWGQNKYDLFKDNFIPIHSYIIDRTRVDLLDLYFDNELPPLEDYEFLLRLGTKYNFNFSKLNTLVCEYRFHENNSIPYSQTASQELVNKYNQAYQLINERKKDLFLKLPILELVNLIAKSEIVLETERCDIDTESDSNIEIEQLAIIENPEPLIPENPQIVRKVLNSVSDNIYTFFFRFPNLERILSNAIHFGFKIRTKFKSRSSLNN